LFNHLHDITRRHYIKTLHTLTLHNETFSIFYGCIPKALRQKGKSKSNVTTDAKTADARAR